MVEEKIGIAVSNSDYKTLEDASFSENIANLITKIIAEILENGVVANKELMLQEADKGIILRDIGTKTEKTADKLKQFYGLDQAKTMVRIIGQPLLKNLTDTTKDVVVDFSQRLIQPNITLNKSATEERKQKVAAEIKPILYQIKTGEMLLREGERVDKIQLLKLNASPYRIENEQILLSSFGSAMIILCILITTYILHFKHQNQRHSNQNKNLLFITSILIAFFFFARISISLSESIPYHTSLGLSASSVAYGIPLASGAMTICLFMGLEYAIPFALLMAVGTAVLFHNKFDI